MKFTPRAFQKEDEGYLLKYAFFGLFNDPGLGKTATVLSAFLKLRAAKKVRKLLVIAPLRPAKLVWSQFGEVGKWDDFAGLKVSIIHGPGKKKENAVNADADIYVVNFEGIQWLTEKLPGLGYAPIQILFHKGVNMLTVDEVTRLKHSTTKRFKALRPWLGKFPRRVALTGSPTANGLIDLHGIAYIIDEGKSLGTYITHFRSRFCEACGFKNKEYRLREGAQHEIVAAMKKIAHSRRATDHLDLPELIERDMWIELPEKVREFYDTYRDDLVAELSGETVTAGSAGILSGKCRQIASGGLYYEEELPNGLRGERKEIHVHDAKTDALEELFDEGQERPLLVYYEYMHSLKRILARFPKAVCIGGLGDAALKNAVTGFNTGKIPMLVAHPASAALGLNLQDGPCNQVVWYDPTFNLEYLQQGIARVWRQGSKEKRIMSTRLAARDTVDVEVLMSSDKKERTQDAFFRALKTMAAEVANKPPAKRRPMSEWENLFKD